MRAWIGIVLISAAISGCQSPLAHGFASEKRIHGMSINEVCNGYVDTRGPAYFSEISGRNEFTEDELKAIREHMVYVGMTARAAVCSWGTIYSHQTTDAGNGPQDALYWYTKSPVKVAIVRDGKVAAYQN